MSSHDPARSRQTGLFRRQGDYWTIVYEGQVVHLKDAKGLHYLAHLLRNPGREFAVAELMAAVARAAGSESDSQRVDADGSAAAERARKAVTNRIRQAVVRIGTVHEPLGRHLRNAVHTGSRCSYTPERPPRWERPSDVASLHEL
jgi:hypothetical protein